MLFLVTGRSFSEDLKWRIVYLYLDGYNKRRISELLYMSMQDFKEL